MYCTKCGQQNYETDAFCSMCGEKFTGIKRDGQINTGHIDRNAQQINVIVNTGKDKEEDKVSGFTIFLGYLTSFIMPGIGFLLGCYTFIKGDKTNGTIIIILSSIMSAIFMGFLV